MSIPPPHEVHHIHHHPKPIWPWLLLGFFALTCGVCGLGCFISGKAISDTVVEQQEKSDALKAKPTIAITAVDLYGRYDANEVAADSNYKGRTLKVTGIVDQIGNDILDSPYVTLNGKKGEAYLSVIQCMFPKDDRDIGNFRKGQRVTIKGICDGKSVTAVMLSECEVIDWEDKKK